MTMARKNRLFITIASVLLLCFGMLVGCQGDSSNQITYTIQVISEGGTALSEIKIYVYADETKANLIWAAETDQEGKVTFEAEEAEGYVAFLQEVPKGYETEESYIVTAEQTEIKLASVLLEANDLTEVTYKLGDVIHDFTVTAVNGTTYKLSELLNEKRAVVLNFWYLNCQPCKMEFPYLQAAYEEYSDEIEVIAINPYDGTNDTVSAYAQENGFTFPMVVGEEDWQSWMSLTSYPTTVIIDQYGNIAMIHKGSITEKAIFTKIFNYFTSDDYEQTTIKNISDIE